MPELRWTLLIIGALFIAGLAIWELRRQRQAPRQNASTQPGSDRLPPTFDTAAGGSEGPHVHREPTITLPELQPEPQADFPADSRSDLRADLHSELRAEPRFGARREPAHDPPVIEMDDASFDRLAADSMEEPVELVREEEEISAWHEAAELAADHEEADLDSHREEPRDDAWRDSASSRAPHGETGRPARRQDALQTAAPASASVAEADAAASGSSPETLSAESPDTSIGFTTDDSDSNPTEVSAPRIRDPYPMGATAAGAPIVDWPGEESRKIVALRLVSAPAARFPGRVVRQALAAEGFVHGKFDIFHKAGPDDRCVLSAASLTKPGTFSVNSMDAQRFGGLSLFAVLPGPLPAQQAFDELLTTARNLNDRLQGALQDERGEPLTPVRSAAIRQSLTVNNGSNGSDVDATSPAETRQ